MPELFVTNFNRNFTGVSATAATVTAAYQDQFDLRLVGHPLPDAPAPISVKQARLLSRTAPKGKPFSIWHVRRNTEMRAAIFARDALRLPVKIVFTSAAQRRHSAFPRWLISRMDAVIATTDAAATYVPHVRAVVPHGVDTKRFSPSDNRASAWKHYAYGGQYGIATIGRVRPEKGTDRFVDAMLDYLPHHPDAVALIIGKATKSHHAFQATLQAKIAQSGLQSRILFIGEIPANDLPALMRSLSLVVQLPQYEGYGMTPLESMASGVPFVACDAGYYRNFCENARYGRIIDPDKPAEIAAAMADVLSGLETHAEHARTAACNRFSATQEAAGIASVYNQLWSQTA